MLFSLWLIAFAWYTFLPNHLLPGEILFYIFRWGILVSIRFFVSEFYNCAQCSSFIMKFAITYLIAIEP
jgi:hypothetical protein